MSVCNYDIECETVTSMCLHLSMWLEVCYSNYDIQCVTVTSEHHYDFQNITVIPECHSDI